ncbi:hypothetical protein H2509_11555 [Stappia sp. F7233]|uniref:Uncharacterized protein n=1 Tax=Stappia albiluteola TaxID=2758565 RepID=A0A839ADB0_9HYPH|nr:hypothetical protein [Stappia albiluteola]MBA5777760.1 hypothetical protein [Stappia albiluteola]
MAIDRLEFLKHLRQLLALFETGKVSVSARLFGVSPDELLTSLRFLEAHFKTTLASVNSDDVKPTAAGDAVHRYLHKAIDDVERTIAETAGNASPTPLRPQRIICGHGANPFTRAVLPEFAEHLSRALPFSFRVEGVASQADIIRDLRKGTAHYGVMLPPRADHSDRPAIGAEPFSPERAVACVYSMRFALITFRNTGIVSLADLLGQRVATGYGLNSLVDGYLDAFLKDGVGGRQFVAEVPCRNIAEAMDKLRNRDVVATLYPIEGLKLSSLARGIVRPLEGTISDETIKSLSATHPGLRVRRGTLFGCENVSIIETPLALYAPADADAKEVTKMIRASMTFFRSYIKHRYGAEPADSYFDPEQIGLKAHPASRQFFRKGIAA